VPDAGDRERIMDIARQVMEHNEFKAVRDALRARLQFTDRLSRDQIERIARTATDLPDATSFRVGEPRTEVAASVRRPGAHSSAAEVADALAGDLQSLPSAGVPRFFRGAAVELRRRTKGSPPRTLRNRPTVGASDHLRPEDLDHHRRADGGRRPGDRLHRGGRSILHQDVSPLLRPAALLTARRGGRLARRVALAV
jgi:hypothetical protein